MSLIAQMDIVFIKTNKMISDNRTFYSSYDSDDQSITLIAETGKMALHYVFFLKLCEMKLPNVR